MDVLTKLIKEDRKPALGVTEPGAIAFAVAKAKSYCSGELESLRLSLNSGIYKNAYSCGIPNSDKFGNLYAAALGYVAGDAEAGLEALHRADEKANQEAEALVAEGKVIVELREVSSEIFIGVKLKTTKDDCNLEIEGSHINITKIVKNGEVLFEKPYQRQEEAEEEALIHQYSLEEILNYVESVPAEELAFIEESFAMNRELFLEGFHNKSCTFLQYLYKKNGKQIDSKDVLATAQLLCNGAIEARVLGLDKPAMSITGSGAHGILATLPLEPEWASQGLGREELWRATALSYLLCMYLKEYSGKLSAFCGCGIAAGTGMASALCYLRGGRAKEIQACIQNMAASITGMICDGGNHGCTMKGVLAVDAAYRSADFAMAGIAIGTEHGVTGKTAEDSLRQMGLIASPGMIETERTIVEIFENK